MILANLRGILHPRISDAPEGLTSNYLLRLRRYQWLQHVQKLRAFPTRETCRAGCGSAMAKRGPAVKKKSAAKKSPAKKTTAKKTPAKKSGAKKAPRKKA